MSYIVSGVHDAAEDFPMETNSSRLRSMVPSILS